MKKQFLFVDTNIWLDFYRIKMDAGAKLLKQLEKIRDQLIVTYQVEMEYKKNRQAVLLEGYKALKKPEPISQPGIFATARSARSIAANIKKTTKLVSDLQSRVMLALECPAVSDAVYQAFQRCHRKRDDLALTRESDEKRQVRRTAFRRFIHGYPPRKPGDTSIGDAVNWEWIMLCAKKHDADIHIASRDSDYGHILEKKTRINDYLAHEFHERVGKRRKIVLHSRLSEALKHLSVPVSAAEAREEEALLKDREIFLRPVEMPDVAGYDLWKRLVSGFDIPPWQSHSSAEPSKVAALNESSAKTQKTESVSTDSSSSQDSSPSEASK